jgi:hypothetical protein
MAAEHEKPSRSARCHPQTLKRYMDKANLPPALLAKKVGVTAKTIYEALKGIPIEKGTVHAIANVLGLSYQQLVEGVKEPADGIYPPIAPPPDDTELRTETVVILNPNLPKFDLTRAIDAIKDMTGIKGDLKIQRIEPGSIRLICQMRHSDILRLIAAMMDTNLSLLGVEGMELANHWWMLRAIALVKVLATPVTPGDDEWAELLNEQAFKFTAHRTPACFFCREPPV